MKLGIMQPYFFPYLGYFQLIHATDKFVIYDNIKYTKKGWINRNRILVNGQPDYITANLRKDSDSLNVDQRHLANDWFEVGAPKLVRRLESLYKKAPYFQEWYEEIRHLILYPAPNLFTYLWHQLERLCCLFGLLPQHCLVPSSVLCVDDSLKSQDRVLATCKAMHADTYINPIGGLKLYNKQDFESNGIQLQFHLMDTFTYPQFSDNFISHLSIIDVLMFNSLEQVKALLGRYSLR